jgi:hypothetical protein
MNLYVYVGGDPVNWADPWGFFQFGTRPLGGGNAPQVPLPGNLSTYHEHGFYDNGDNVGYFPQGIGPDTAATQSGYDMIIPYYDDVLMVQAVQNLRNSGRWLPDDPNEPWYSNSNPNDYDLTLHNCQDFADALREEYERLGGNTCSIPFNYAPSAVCMETP